MNNPYRGERREQFANRVGPTLSRDVNKGMGQAREHFDIFQAEQSAIEAGQRAEKSARSTMSPLQAEAFGRQVQKETLAGFHQVRKGIDLGIHEGGAGPLGANAQDATGPLAPQAGFDDEEDDKDKIVKAFGTTPMAMIEGEIPEKDRRPVEKGKINGKPVDEAKWAKAKKLASDQGRSGDYAYITGIYEKMEGIKPKVEKQDQAGAPKPGPTIAPAKPTQEGTPGKGNKKAPTEPKAKYSDIPEKDRRK